MNLGYTPVAVNDLLSRMVYESLLITVLKIHVVNLAQVAPKKKGAQLG